MNDGSVTENDIPSDLSDSVSEEEDDEEEEEEDEESRKRRRERMAAKEAKRMEHERKRQKLSRYEEYNYYSRPVSFQVRNGCE